MINETTGINTTKITSKFKKRLAFASAATILVVLGAVSTYTGYVYSENKNWEGLIYPGVKVEDVTLEGKTKEEARNLLKDLYGDEIVKKKINITADKNTYSLDYSKLNARYNIDNIVDEAFSYGKSLGMFKKYEIINNPLDKQYELKFSYDGQYVKEIIGSMEKDINKEPVNAAMEMVSSGKFKVNPDVKGYKLKSEALEKEILDKINGELSGDIKITAVIEELTAPITGDKLSAVDAKIASFSTSFGTSSRERSYNIDLATKAVNGKLLMPGDTFSFNETVGERTAKRGYKEAPVIVNNKIESGLGGGICQVSSTLYNAILKTGIDKNALGRVHHSLVSSYVPIGQDATVDWGNIDFKFKNTLEYPIWIEGYSKNKQLYFNLYSSSSLTKQSYSINNQVYETVKATVKYIDDPKLPEGETVIERKAQDGYRVKVIKNTYEGKKIIKTEVVSTDYYKPINGIIRKGIKKQ